jgi:hypothetical protein
MLGNYSIVREYRGPESKWADDHFCELLTKGMAIPTLPQVAEICVRDNLKQSDADFMSSTVRLDYDDRGRKIDVYVHVPLQRGLKDFHHKYDAFQHPFLNEASAKKILEGPVKDKHGNQVVFVVDGKSEAGMWKAHSDYFSNDGKWRRHSDITLKSVEDALRFPSVVAIFGGEENFARYAGHYGIGNVKLYYPALLSMEKGIVNSQFLCLRDGSPEPYNFGHSAFNRIEMERGDDPEFDFSDFVTGRPGTTAIRF